MSDLTRNPNVPDDCQPARYVTAKHVMRDDVPASPDSTPLASEIQDPEAYRLYSLCPCENCKGRGRLVLTSGKENRCKECRGEGRKLSLVATCGSKAAVGVALVTLSEEGHWDGDCPFGLMHRPEGEKGRWLIKPWQASARNVSDAGRLLRSQR